MTARSAAIDVGTNSVLLLVAERDEGGGLHALAEELSLTRLGEGVDRTGRIGERAFRDTCEAVRAFASRARELGASELSVVSTSAARDAENGPAFLAALREAAGVSAQILSGEEEAELSYRSVAMDFGEGPLWALDIGGGSTELIFGVAGELRDRHSFDIGAVRLSERCISSDPPSAEELRGVEAEVARTFAQVERPRVGATLVGIAGTVTTLAAIHLGLASYDAERVQGAKLGLEELRALEAKLASLPLEERLKVPGLQPKRADVIVAGAIILRVAMEHLGFAEVAVSDKGVRWGLLAARSGS